MKSKVSLVVYRKLKGMLEDYYYDKKSNLSGDGSDIDWEATYAIKIVNLIGNDLREDK